MTLVLFAHKKISVTRARTTNEWDALRHTRQRETRNARGRQASNGLSRFVDVADTPIGERRGAALQTLAIATLSPSLSHALYTGILARYIFQRTRVLPATMRVNPVFALSRKSTALMRTMYCPYALTAVTDRRVTDAVISALLGICYRQIHNIKSYVL